MLRPINQYPPGEIDALLVEARRTSRLPFKRLAQRSGVRKIPSADEYAERATQLIAESRAVLARHPSRRPPATQKSPIPIPEALLDEMIALQSGRILGRKFGHNAHQLAQHLGVTVQHDVPLATLQDATRPSTTILGRIWKLPYPIVQLADTLGGYNLNRVLAHELGHYLGFSQERLCDVFAKEFQRISDDEMPGGKWRPIQGELLERARRAAQCF